MPNGISPPDLMLKIIWMVHFALATWAMMSTYLPIPYLFCHLGVLGFCAWAIISRESTEAIIMTFMTLAFSVVNDIILISIYHPRNVDSFEHRSTEVRNEFRFAVGMSIANLIIKPVSLFLLYRIYQSRSTGENIFGGSISGVFGSDSGNPSQPQSAPAGPSRPGQNQGAYSNIDSTQTAHPGIYGQNPNPQPYYQGQQSSYQSMPQGYQDPPSGSQPQDNSQGRGPQQQI